MSGQSPSANACFDPRFVDFRSGGMSVNFGGIDSVEERARLLLEKVIKPALYQLSFYGVDSDVPHAHMLVAIAYQESAIQARDQNDPGQKLGPALGLWQFERDGAVAEVLEHPKLKLTTKLLLDNLGIKTERRPLWEALATDDVLACMLARLIIGIHPKGVPKVTDSAAGWALYKARWRPGKPKPDTWPVSWKVATKAIPIPCLLPTKFDYTPPLFR